MQEIGSGQNALAQGAIAPQYQNAILQNAILQPGLTRATINLTGAETQKVGNTAQQVPANAAATRYNQLVHGYMASHPTSPISAAVAWAQKALSAMGAPIATNLNASAPPAPNPTNYVPPASSPASSGATLSSGGISFNGKPYMYTATKPYQGGTIYFIPALNNWVN